MGQTLELPYKCRITAKNKSSVDAYHICFMFPNKVVPFNVEGASGDFDKLNSNDTPIYTIYKINRTRQEFILRSSISKMNFVI